MVVVFFCICHVRCWGPSYFALGSRLIGVYVTIPSFAFSLLIACPSCAALPSTPAITWTHLRLSSLAGIGYVTQVGFASVSMMPIVGMAFNEHSCSITQFSSGLRQTTRSGFNGGCSSTTLSNPLITRSYSSTIFFLQCPRICGPFVMLPGVQRSNKWHPPASCAARTTHWSCPGRVPTKRMRPPCSATPEITRQALRR